MQFEPATFAQYAGDGNHNGQFSPYDPADAVYSAAAMLCANSAASGTAAGIRQAVFAYNHSQAYVNDVLGWAARYTIPVPSGAAATALAFALRQISQALPVGLPGRTPGAARAWSARRLRRRRHSHRPRTGWRRDGPSGLLHADPAQDAVLRRVRRHARQPQHAACIPRRRPDRPAPERGRQIDPLDLAGWLWPPVPQTCLTTPEPPEEPMPVTIAQLRASATVDLMTAARALGLGRTKAYELARRDQFPCRVIRIGDTYRIPTAGLLELLGVTAEEPRGQTPAGHRP
jgi:hypothetical protein